MTNPPTILAAIAAMLICGCTAYDVDTPDTKANRAGFERHLKTKPSAAISQVYYYADEMGTDVRYQLSFKCDRKTIDQIVSALALVQAESDDSGLAPRDDLKWWKPGSTKGRTLWEREKKDQHHWELWHSEEDNIAFYHEYSI